MEMEAEVAVTIKIPYHYKVYETVVLITGPQTADGSGEALVGLDYFKEQAAKYEDWNWLREIPPEKHLICVTDEFLRNYEMGNFLPQNSILSPQTAMDQGRFDLVFENRLSPTGYLYQDGKPLNRSVFLEFWGSTYDIPSLAKKLETIEEFVKTERQKSNAHNLDLVGSEVLLTWYKPSAKEFQAWQDLGAEWYMMAPGRIRDNFSDYILAAEK